MKTVVLAINIILLASCKTTTAPQSSLAGGAANNITQNDRYSGISKVLKVSMQEFLQQQVGSTKRDISQDFNVNDRSFGNNRFDRNFRKDEIEFKRIFNDRNYSYDAFGRLTDRGSGLYGIYSWPSKNGIQQEIKFSLWGPIRRNGKETNEYWLRFFAISYQSPQTFNKDPDLVNLTYDNRDFNVTTHFEFENNRASSIRVECCDY